MPTLLRSLNLTNARVVARTLAATGHLEALNEVTSPDSVTEELWRGLVHVLRFESPLFGEGDLLTIETAATGLSARATAELYARIKQATADNTRMPSYRIDYGGDDVSPRPPRLVVPLDEIVQEVRSVISRIRYLRLAKTIRERQNPTVDADRQVLLSRLQAMGFSDELSDASSEIEQRAATATTETDVKTVMDLLRSFFEEFTEEACRKVEARLGKPVPSGPKLSHYAPYRQYLESARFIGFEESEFLQKLYNFLSNQGTHKLGSAPEQLKVAHTTVIEWCMLIAGRINDFLSN